MMRIVRDGTRLLVDIDGFPRREAIARPAGQTPEDLRRLGFLPVSEVWKSHEVHPYSEPGLALDDLWVHR